MSSNTINPNTISPVPNNQPLADKSGMVSLIWSGFFNDIWLRAGGAIASSNTSLQTQIDNFVLSAANTIKGNNTGSQTNAFDLSPAEVNAMLPVFTSLLKGLVPLSGGGTTNFLRADGAWAIPLALDYFVSSQVTTTSGALTSATFTTADNSPALSVVPNFTGTYKVYCSIPSQITDGTSAKAAVRIIKTSGTGTLLSESQAMIAGATSVQMAASLFAQSTYTLTKGVTYIFDIQGSLISGTNLKFDGVDSPFYMFAERAA